MRILIFTQYFPPEVGATQTRLHTFAAGLAERGHDVDVVCEVPNHPHGVVRAGYGNRPFDRRRLDGFGVTYVWVRTNPTKTTRTRLAFYSSYMAMASVAGSVARRPDVIFASSPPLPVAVAAAVVALRHRVPWVLDVRDLWPEAAAALGELSNARLLTVARTLERWLYKNAAAITTVTESFRDSIAERGGDLTKIHLVPNGTSWLYVRAASLQDRRAVLGLPTDRFLWTYAGNVGIAQGLEVAINAAASLGDGFQLLILGDGPARASLENHAQKLVPGGVLFRDQVSEELATHYLRSSDALLVPLADRPEFEKFVPSKLYDFSAVGRPIILACAGEALRRARAHVFPVPPGDADGLAAAVRRLQRDPGLRDRLAEAGRSFGAAHLREHHVATLELLLRTVVGRKRGAAEVASM